MIVDSSVLISILNSEEEALFFSGVLYAARERLLAAPTFLEAGIIVDARRDPVRSRRFDGLLNAAGIEIVPFSFQQARIAREAYRDFGKGSGHPAQLNFGDCFSYALAKDLDLPLLYKGDDFSKTDVRSASDACSANTRS